MLTQRLLRAGGLLTLGGAKLDSSLFIRAPREGLFSPGTVVMVNTRASRDTWMWARLSAHRSSAATSGTLSGVTSEQIINLFLSLSLFLILLSSGDEAVKHLNINRKIYSAWKSTPVGSCAIGALYCMQSSARQSWDNQACCTCCEVIASGHEPHQGNNVNAWCLGPWVGQVWMKHHEEGSH